MAVRELTQEKIWDNIATPWKEFRGKPVPEVKEFLKNKGGKILDLGCGTGRNFIKVDGTIYGIDFSRNMLNYAKESAEKNKVKVILKKSKADKLPFTDNFFDSAVYIATLHCLPSEEERKKSLEELYRTMKPGAEAMISVWDKNQEKFKDVPKQNFISWKVDRNEFRRYYYLYDKDEIIDLLKEVGLKIIKVYEKGNENKEYSKRKAYSERNIIVIVKK